MNAPRLLPTRLKNPFDWSPAGKCWFLLLMTALLHTEYLSWALYLRDHPAPEFVNAAYLQSQLATLRLVCIGSWGLVLVLPGLHRLIDDSVLYEYFALIFYGLTLCYASHFTGTLSIAAGAVLAGAPVFGFIFFRTGPVLAALGAGLLVEGLISWGAVQGRWPYAPLIANFTDSQGHLSLLWMVSLYSFALPHIVMLGGLSFYFLRRWRQREAEILYLSLTDALTGLPNRRNVMTELQRHLEISRRYDLPLAVMMVDVDHFKCINDTYGHPAGDAVLAAVAKRLHGALRQSDTVGRFGGEEFLAVLTGTSLEGARILAERCRHSLDTEPVRLTDGRELHVTASFGICSMAEHRSSADDMLKEADQALYAAKQRGRNRVEPAFDTCMEAMQA